MVDRLVIFLTEEGYRVRTEVPNMGQSADVIATRNRWITAVEAKVRDWRRGLKQCAAHNHVADFVCIAVGTKSVSAPLQHAVRTCGYGLIHCPLDGDSCEWVVRPRRNDGVWRPQRLQLSQALRAIQHER